MKGTSSLSSFQKFLSNYSIFLTIAPPKRARKKFFLAQILHTFSKHCLSHFSIFSAVIHSINRLSTIFRLIHSHSEQLRKTGKAPCKTSASPCKAQQKRPVLKMPSFSKPVFHIHFCKLFNFSSKTPQPPCFPVFPRFSSLFF